MLEKAGQGQREEREGVEEKLEQDYKSKIDKVKERL